MAGVGGVVGRSGNSMPSDFELKVRLSQAPDTESDGSSAARACLTRASASSVRSVASATTGTSPEAKRTASANDSRSGVVGAGVCPSSVMGVTTNHASRVTSRRLLLRNTMEIEIDVNVEVLPDVEPLRHARRERAPRYDRVHQRRHGELRGHLHVHGPEFTALDAPLDHPGHQAVPA